MSVNPDSGDVKSETDTIAVTVTPTKKMKFGTHLGTVKVYSLDAYNSPQNLLVRMKIKGPTINLKRKNFLLLRKQVEGIRIRWCFRLETKVLGSFAIVS